LRYQLICCASRSLIADATPPAPVPPPGHAPSSARGGAGAGAAGGAVIMPLFRRGVDRERFECGVAWLRKNVQQVRQGSAVVGYPYLGPHLAPI